MKAFVKSVLAVGIASLSVLALAGCRQNAKPNQPTTSYVYNSQSNAENDSSAGETGENSIMINNEWMKNYQVTYRYTRVEETEQAYSVTEKRSEAYFLTEYMDGGDILYYTQSDQGVESYMIIPGQTTQLHTTLSGKKLSDLSSTFMKLTAVSEDLPRLANVVYVCDEYIAGRPAAKYIQRAYQNGALTQTVYLWVDKEFGFALKCFAYNEQNVLTTSWEVISFENDVLTDENVKIDLSQYRFSDSASEEPLTR